MPPLGPRRVRSGRDDRRDLRGGSLLGVDLLLIISASGQFGGGVSSGDAVVLRAAARRRSLARFLSL